MKKVLVVAGDFYHSMEVVKRGLLSLNMQEVEFDFVCDALNVLTVDMINEYDIVTICKGDSMTPYNSNSWMCNAICEVGGKELEEYVKNGKSLMVLHAGTCFKVENCPDFVNLVGCSFSNHPPLCKVNVEIVSEHPICKGVSNFEINDEHYHLNYYDENVEVLMKATSDSGTCQTAGYVKELGKGKICVLTPGHKVAVWQNPSYSQILKNAINWCL